MNSLYRQNRLRTANYSSELKATIDILVETYLAKNQHNQAETDKLNKAREEWIKEVDECEESNLAELENSENRDLMQGDDNLLKRFCFIFEYRGDVLETGCFMWRFISTDTFLSPSQIACFQVMASCFGCDSGEFDYARVFSAGLESLERLFKVEKTLTTNVNNERIFILFNQLKFLRNRI
jgi:hypothetical protein